MLVLAAEEPCRFKAASLWEGILSDADALQETRPDLPGLAAAALQRDGTAPAIEFENKWYSWGDMARVARTVMRLLDEAGADVRAPTALVARNRPAAVAALLGLIAAGRSVQMIYAFQSAQALANDIVKLQPGSLVIMAEDLSAPVTEALRSVSAAAIRLDGMSAAPLEGQKRARASGVDLRRDPQIEVLTSGTTGPPKRFPISFDMIARHHMGNTGMAGATRGQEDNGPPFLLFYPLGNISGIYSTVPTMLRGQKATLLDRFSLAAWHQFILRYRPAAAGIPTTGFRMLLDADIPPEDLASLRVIATGAAPLDPSIQRAFEEKFGIPVLSSYGATEFGGPVAAMTLDLVRQFGSAKRGSVGRPLPGARLRVVDPETGDELPAGAEGLLEVVSPRIGQDWIRTSDIAVIDEDGFLFIRGRADGAIIRGGFKLVPEVIERALMLHPSVGAVSVVGVADERLGAIPAAAVQLAPDAPRVTPDELEAHARAHLPATHIPVLWRFIDDLPKNPSMKVERQAVQRLFQG